MSNARNQKENGLTVFLHFYTGEISMHEKIMFYPGERRRIEISSERLHTAYPVVFVLEKEGQVWKLNQTAVSENSFFTLKTEAGEGIILVISRGRAELLPCGRILLYKKSEVNAGSAFQNEIFYECFSFILPRHIRIYREDENWILESCGEKRDKKEQGGLYVNGRAVKKCILNRGDFIELWGLTLLYLTEILICTDFYGTLRTAEGKDELPLTAQENAAEILAGESGIKEMSAEEKPLHQGEFQLAMPETERIQSATPLVLSLGPAVTMAVPMLLMASFGGAILGQTGAEYYKLSLIMTISTAVFSVMWGIINHVYKKKVSQKEIIRRKEVYREYLAKTEQYLSLCLKENQSALLHKYPSCQSYFAGEGKIFWNRNTGQKDYMFVRLGLGEIPFQIVIKSGNVNREFNSDSLVQEAFGLTDKYRMLPDVPIGFDLRKVRLAGFAGSLIYPVFLQALVQMAACYSFREMKIAFFYDEKKPEERRIADCIKWLPHVWKSGRKLRLLAGNEKEAGEILPELIGELQKESQWKKGHIQDFYVLAAANQELVKGEGLLELLAENSGNRVCTLFLHKDREEIPGDCQYLVIKDKEKEEIICYEKEGISKRKIMLENCSPEQTENYMRKLADLRMQSRGQGEERREKVSFLDLYSCNEIEELNCYGRWKKNRTADRIRVPVGMGCGDRIVYLDVHEKFHGPHGLVAGTTGSGKSELLQTYLLSLAVSFSPEDINFFIIDYKGGGMGNVLCSLPHCAGVISNLSGRQIKRALASIKSENRRRQELLSLSGVNHVEDYTRLYKEGKVPEAVPHLILVVDEFAELKKEEPEFMQEIISVAQVGRSLGVHLILSTQKPAGTVDDKIWSNTRFRLCLRVADKQDSMDMLHRPEAAYLTGAGQCYIQVGNNEMYELFQAGYSGEEYDGAKQPGDAVYMVAGTGKRSAVNREKLEKSPTQLQAVTDYICRTAKHTGSGRAKKLWMPELPEKLFLEEAGIRESGNTKGDIVVCTGICDDPEKQEQYPLFYNPEADGHLSLCGAPATGKSTFLQTILWQLCTKYTPEQVQFLLLSSDNAGVNCYENMPHCLGNMKKKEDAECFFYHAERLLEKRKKAFGGINFLQYRKHAGENYAFIFFIVDNYGSFRQMTEDKYQPLLERLAGEGINYGIYLMITALNVGTGEIPGKLFEKIKTTFSMEMSDRFQYGDVLRRYQLSLWPKENVKGRGLCRIEERILEFQVPLAAGEEDDYLRIRRVEELCGSLTQTIAGAKALKRFPRIPEKPLWHSMFNSFCGLGKNTENICCPEIPLGYEEKSGYIRTLSIKEGFSFLISGEAQTGKRNLLLCMMHGMWKQKMETVLFDRKHIISEQAKRAADREKAGKLLHIITDEKEFAKWYQRYVKQNDFKVKGCLCICELTDFSRMLGGCKEEILTVKENMEELIKENRLLPVIALQTPGREMEAFGTPVFEMMISRQWGIHLGGNPGNQRMLSFDDLDYHRMNQWEMPGTGYLKRGFSSRTERIRLPLYEEKGEEKAEDDFSGYLCPGSE